jgi:hypothetical protein
MIYAQIRSGRKLHLAFEAGEGRSPDKLIPAGRIGAPLCGERIPVGGYRMTINVPLGHACKRCQRVYQAMHTDRESEA